MHVLTKVFIVLVALLAVMLVPLVVVYAKNESNYKVRYEQALAKAAAANVAAETANRTAATRVQAAQSEIDNLTNQLSSARQQAAAKEGQIAELQSEVATARATSSQINAKISPIWTRLDSGQSLIEELVRESGGLRSTALAAERQNAELQQALNEQNRNLEVAESAVRSLQEELQRVSDARNQAVERIAMIRQMYPNVDDTVRPGEIGVPVTRKITAGVIDVQHSAGVILAEIDAGQRDGLKEGMVLTLGDGSGNYIGRLHITRVDLNRATGVAETPYGDPAPVQLGHHAFAFPR